MSIETSNKILKVTGIITLIFGILGVIAGIVLIIGARALGTVADVAPGEEEAAAAVGMGATSLIVGIILLISSIVEILEGWFSVRASKDNAKIMPAWIFAILGVIGSVGQLISSLSEDPKGIISAIIAVALSVLIFVAANTIKKSNV